MVTMPYGLGNHGIQDGQLGMNTVLDMTTLALLDLMIQLLGQHKFSMATNIGMGLPGILQQQQM